jgi:hypothetical protein
VAWAELGLAGTHDVRDLWARKDLGAFKDKFAAQIPAHGAGLFRIGNPGRWFYSVAGEKAPPINPAS